MDIPTALAYVGPPPCAKCVNVDLCLQQHLACKEFFQYVAGVSHGRTKRNGKSAGAITGQLAWMSGLPPMAPRRDIYLTMFPEPKLNNARGLKRTA